MKKILIIYTGLCLSIVLLFLNHPFVKAKEISKKDCEEQFNEKVLQDIKSSFPELKVLKGKDVYQYTHKDIDRAMFAIGGKSDPHLQSIYPLFTGVSRGERNFFVVTNGPSDPESKYESAFLGYFLYKKTDGTNVMIKMKPSDKKWDIIAQREVPSKITEWKCKK